MKTRYKLATKNDRDAIKGVIDKLPLEKFVIAIEKDSGDLSDKQRRLYFMWIGEINTAQSGRAGGKDGLHLRMKERFLRPILMREDEGYAEMVEALERVKTLDNAAYQTLNNKVNELTSIRGLEKHLMTEYLNDIEAASLGAGIPLTHPDDLYHAALGRYKTKEEANGKRSE